MPAGGKLYQLLLGCKVNLILPNVEGFVSPVSQGMVFSVFAYVLTTNVLSTLRQAEDKSKHNQR